MCTALYKMSYVCMYCVVDLVGWFADQNVIRFVTCCVGRSAVTIDEILA